MEVFINGIGLISPQKTTEAGAFLSEVIEHNADYLKCIDPNYKAFIDPLAARRMSRLIKMGITSAKLCLAEAGITMPDAIITGTGLGSVEDTEKILNSILQHEQLLNPTVVAEISPVRYFIISTIPDDAIASLAAIIPRSAVRVRFFIPEFPVASSNSFVVFLTSAIGIFPL